MKLRCLTNALSLAWTDKSFRLWVIICASGIGAALLAGVGMSSLVLLVSVACIGLGLEVMNTSIETLMDIIHPEYSLKVKVVKDAFGAVPVFAYSAYIISWLIIVLGRII